MSLIAVDIEIDKAIDTCHFDDKDLKMFKDKVKKLAKELPFGDIILEIKIR